MSQKLFNVKYHKLKEFFGCNTLLLLIEKF